jgi:hypothetical protein
LYYIAMAYQLPANTNRVLEQDADMPLQ